MAIGDLGDPIPESVTVEVSAFSGVLPEVLPVSIQVVNASHLPVVRPLKRCFGSLDITFHGVEVVFEPLIAGTNT